MRQAGAEFSAEAREGLDGGHLFFEVGMPLARLIPLAAEKNIIIALNQGSFVDRERITQLLDQSSKPRQIAIRRDPLFFTEAEGAAYHTKQDRLAQHAEREYGAIPGVTLGIGITADYINVLLEHYRQTGTWLIDCYSYVATATTARLNPRSIFDRPQRVLIRRVEPRQINLSFVLEQENSTILNSQVIPLVESTTAFSLNGVK